MKIGGNMHRHFVFALAAALLLAAPFWTFNDGWGYGPLIAIAFLLILNVAVLLINSHLRLPWRSRQWPT
jgi:hypothetical protein